jgi:hypothetical protein
VVVSEMSVFESGLPPSGGDALPPNSEVMRRMKVDLPQPESAARPMTTGPSRAARTTVFTRAARVLTGAPSLALEPKDLRAARGCAQAADMVMVVAIFGEVVCLSNGDWTTRRRVLRRRIDRAIKSPRAFDGALSSAHYPRWISSAPSGSVSPK